MSSKAYEDFKFGIQDATDLANHFDKLNTKPPPPDIEVLKRASLVLALAALESFFEDRVREAVHELCAQEHLRDGIKGFYLQALDVDLKTFHSPNSERVGQLYRKYLSIEVSSGWVWNNCDPEKAKKELDRLVKKRGDIAHRSLRPVVGEAQPREHAVTRDDLRKALHFIARIAETTDRLVSGG